MQHVPLAFERAQRLGEFLHGLASGVFLRLFLGFGRGLGSFVGGCFLGIGMLGVLVGGAFGMGVGIDCGGVVHRIGERILLRGRLVRLRVVAGAHGIVGHAFGDVLALGSGLDLVNLHFLRVGGVVVGRDGVQIDRQIVNVFQVHFVSHAASLSWGFLRVP